MQQIFSNKSVVEKYAPKYTEILKYFTGLYSLDPEDEHYPQIIENAKKYPSKFVLKPQREGGGNNFFDDDLLQKLNTLSPKELSGYILMDRIVSKPYKTLILRDGEINDVDGVCEIGIFSVYIGYKGRPFFK